MSREEHPSFDSVFNSIAWGQPLLAYLYNFVVAKILQNSAKFIQKLTPDCKTSNNESGQLQTSSGKSKSWNSLGYFCPKSRFLQLKHHRGFI